MTTPPSCDDPDRRVPRAYVDRPGPGAPTQFGLFSAAQIIEGVPRHELNGIEFEPVCNTEVWEWPVFCGSYGLDSSNPEEIGRPDPRCNPAPIEGRWTAEDGYESPDYNGDGDFVPPYALKRLDVTKGHSAADPFAVYAADQCFTGNHDSALALGNLRERFRVGEQEAVERVLYNGFLPDPERPDWTDPEYPDPALPHLRPALRWDPVVLGGGQPLPVTHAIGLLEHWLQATTGSRGIIHAPAYMATALGGNDVVTSSGPRATTRLGHLYVFGTGYSGRQPLFSNGSQAPADGKPTAWLYATRPITIRRSAVIEPADWMTGAVNTRNNTGSLVIERMYVTSWPCSAAAVRTDYPLYDLAPLALEAPAPPAARTREDS